MRRIYKLLLVMVFLLPVRTKAQQVSDKYLPDKPGKWSYSSNIKSPGAEVVALNKNLATLAEWFHQNVPMLSQPKGYDLGAVAYGRWDDHYKLSTRNYGLRADLIFDFRLFLSDGGKWTVEPPHYEFNVNNTESGHATNPTNPTFNNLEDDPKLEKVINDAATRMNEVFAVLPFVRELAPGVNYYDDESHSNGTVVVFNPDRPDFWLPITVKELAEIYIEYYKIKNKTELDRMVFAQLEKEISELTEDELNAPAFSGHDEHYVFSINGKGQGLQVMRFNSGYWNRALPPSAIQFLTFYFPQSDAAALAEYLKNNGHPYYSQLLVNQINWEKLAGMIQK